MAYSDLTTMRNDFLAQTQAKLLAKDFATATDSDLILSGVLIQKFDAVNNFDPISSSAISLLTGVSNFNTFLGDLSNRQAFEDAIASPSAMAAIIANSTVFANILASSTAMAAVASSSTVMNTIIASASGFANILASSTAMSAVAVSKTALSIIWGSESLLSEVRANQSAVDKLVSSPRTIYLNNNPSNLTTVQVSGKCILIKCKSDSVDTGTLNAKYSNGTNIGDYQYASANSFTNQLVSFVDFKHKQKSTNNHIWHGYVIDCD